MKVQPSGAWTDTFGKRLNLYDKKWWLAGWLAGLPSTRLYLVTTRCGSLELEPREIYSLG
jgi:hypothetical protein